MIDPFGHIKNIFLVNFDRLLNEFKKIKINFRVGSRKFIFKDDCLIKITRKNRFLETVLTPLLEITPFYNRWHSSGCSKWPWSLFLTVSKKSFSTRVRILGPRPMVNLAKMDHLGLHSKMIVWYMILGPRPMVNLAKWIIKVSIQRWLSYICMVEIKNYTRPSL